MKHLQLLAIGLSLTLFVNSCASAYVHNTIKTPILDNNQTVDIAASVSASHSSASVSVKIAPHIQVLAAGHVSKFDINSSDYKDLGIGYLGKIDTNIYIGAYYTFGEGYRHKENINILFFISDYYGIKCSYYRNSVTGYIKYKYKTLTPYMGFRLSHIHYKYYQYYLIGSSSSFTRSNFGQWLLEPVVGMDVNLGKGFYMYAQQIFMLPIDSSIFEGYDLMNSHPRYQISLMRIGFGYVWQKPHPKTVYRN